MSEVSVSMNGPQLIAELRAFKEAVAIRAVRNATKRIAAMLLEQVRFRAPVFTGRLRFNLGVKSKYVASRGVVVSKVIINTRGDKDNKQNAYYWRFVEFDHQTRGAKKAPRGRMANDGRLRGGRIVKGQNFVQETMAAFQMRIPEMFYKDLQKAIEFQKRKAARAAAKGL